MSDDDLQKLRIPTVFGEGRELEDYSTGSADGSTKVYFRNLDKHLTDAIRGADLVVGCVAWLTHSGILAALKETQGVSIIVQKEDFLRPDVGRWDGWKDWLRKQYVAIPTIPGLRHLQGVVLRELYIDLDIDLEPVRCVGHHNAEKRSAFPRAHHKFVVFCRLYRPGKRDAGKSVDNYTQHLRMCGLGEERIKQLLNWHGTTLLSLEDGEGWEKMAEQERSMPDPIRPYAVWTGSFNFSKNASVSLENAVLLTDPSIVYAYYNEWAQIAALSEPLDWTSQWSAPDLEIGTFEQL